MSALTFRHRGSVAALLAVALTATACGSSSSAAKGAATTGAPTSMATTAAAAATTGAATSAAATSAAPGPTSAAAPTPTTTKVVAKGGGKFCKQIADTLNNPAVSGDTSTPAKAKAQIAAGLAQLANLSSQAPSAIRGDVAVLAKAIGGLYAAVTKVNYDFTKLDPNALKALDTPAVKAAEANVDTYVKSNCGIDVAASASS